MSTAHYFYCVPCGSHGPDECWRDYKVRDILEVHEALPHLAALVELGWEGFESPMCLPVSVDTIKHAVAHQGEGHQLAFIDEYGQVFSLEDPGGEPIQGKR